MTTETKPTDKIFDPKQPGAPGARPGS